jgi:hypothetical protein
VGARVFLTNAMRLATIPALQVLVLDQLQAAAVAPQEPDGPDTSS